MVAVTTQRLTAEEFDIFAALPENEDRLLEFIDGEIYDVVSALTSSEIAALVIAALGSYLRTNPVGRVTGADGGFKVGRNRFIPDLAYTSKARLASFAGIQGYGPIPPDIAVEVMSPSDTTKKVATKIANYITAGVIVWAVYPDDKEVIVHIPGQQSYTLTVNDVLDGTTHANGLLPGFTLPINQLFEQEPPVVNPPVTPEA